MIFFLYFRTNTENASFQHNKHVGISSNVTVAVAVTDVQSAIHQHARRSQTSTPLIHSGTDDVVIQVAPVLSQSHVNTHALMAMLETAIFDHLFKLIRSNRPISAMDRLVVVKFHTNIANRWLL